MGERPGDGETGEVVEQATLTEANYCEELPDFLKEGEADAVYA